MKWTAEEINYLEEHCRVESAKAIAEKLGRTECSVKQKASVMGLDTSRLLPDDYMTVAEISKLFGVKDIRNWIDYHHLKKYWFETFNNKLLLAYHVDDVEKLKMERKARRKYTEKEINTIMELYENGVGLPKISAVTGLPVETVQRVYRYWRKKL